MKKLLTSTVSLAVLIGAMSTASAKENDFSGYFSVGQSALYDTYGGGFFDAGPFNLEIMVGKEVVQGIELNVGFMFGVDTASSPYRDTEVNQNGSIKASAKYLGFRPGVRLFLGDDRGHNYGGIIRPYLRAAFPFDIQFQKEPTDASGAPLTRPDGSVVGSRTFVNIGLLVGGGLEYRWKHVGIFGEVLVIPFFRDFYMPVEFRAGVAMHF